MAQTKNSFLKGKMNQDLDSRIVPNGEYREAFNLQISRSEGDTVGEFENVLGNSLVTDLGGTQEIIGYHVDQSNNIAYLFATDFDDSTGNSRATGANTMGVYQYNFGTNNLVKLVVGFFLNFNKSFLITGVNLVEDLLFWTDNLNQPRKINVSLANPTNLATPTHYQTEDQISVAKYYPFDPIIALNIDHLFFSLDGAVTASNQLDFDEPISGRIKVGDVIMDRDRGAGDTLYITTKITVIAITAASTILLSADVTLPDGHNVQFFRSSMTDKDSQYRDNYITVAVTSFNSGTGELIGTISGGSASYNIGWPRIGDILTLKSGTGTVPLASANTPTTITAVQINDLGGGLTATIKSSATITLTAADTVYIGVNQFYDDTWVGDASFLEDKFIRFSYRFKFEDNEYSLMAPFTQPMFIPKQRGEFGGGDVGSDEDMDNTYKSTIVSWFENSIDNIDLKIPIPFSSTGTSITTAAALQSNLKITEIDVLYKESDALAVKVVDTINVADLNQSTTFDSIRFDDFIYSGTTVLTKYYYTYNYSSSKPYKTLPEGQTVRVYDKVPVKALAQELAGNRVIYGNYTEKQTPPSALDYSATVQVKKSSFENIPQFPFSSVKQNRTYQVGFVLADRFGRQSGVILSSYDDSETVEGSTVYAPYKTRSQQAEGSPAPEPVLDWVGDALNIRLNTAVATTNNPATGEPGVYSSTNPMGWYSYKIVVKQQEQDYYNVYLPGFVAGDPVVSSTNTTKYSYSISLSDNLNKVPRDLKEVGPTDTEYNSSEILYVRVNNPNINDRVSRPPGYPLKETAWNAQYYPGTLGQDVLSISTVRDFEIAAIPFVPNASAGQYGALGSNYDSGTGDTTPTTIGSIPWGTSPPDQPLYSSDLNPFAIKISTAENGSIPTATGSTVPGPIGAICSSVTMGTSGQQQTMNPFLSIAETKPLYSKLEIFYETSLSGRLDFLNENINAQYGGIESLEVSSANFAEDAVPATQIGGNFNFIDGSGSQITNNSYFRDAAGVAVAPIIQQVTDQTGADRTAEDLFQIVYSGGSGEYQLKTNTGKYFWYNQNCFNNTDGIYTIIFRTTYTPGTPGTDPTYSDDTTFTATLTNVAPAWQNDPGAPVTGITTGSTTIFTYQARNGSADATNYERELVWDLDPSNSASILSIFSIDSVTGVLTAGAGLLVDSTTYTVIARVTDVAGDGLSTQCSIQLTVGTQYVPQAICDAWDGITYGTCGANSEWLFAETNSTAVTAGGNYTGSVSAYPYPPDNLYNVRVKGPIGATTGALTQGVMTMTPTLTSTCVGSDASIYYSIQYRTSDAASWGPATCDSSSPAQGAGGVVAYDKLLTCSSSDSPDSDTYWFSQVGEYRVITKDMAGSACTGPCGTNKFYVQYGDKTYPGSCSGPL